uniref:hypothetical protein n=1 Tax=Rhizobium bangladeshense TaxID=1138189 RepID=UPI002180B31F
MRQVAVMGAAGRVGKLLRPFFRQHIEHLRLIDIHEPADLAENESFVGEGLVKKREIVS